MDPFIHEMFKSLETLDKWYDDNIITLEEYFDIKSRIVENCKKKLDRKEV